MRKIISLKKHINPKLIFKIFLICIIFYSVLFSIFAIISHQKNKEFCKSQRDYIQVHIQAALEGKLDSGHTQKDSNGKYYIDFQAAEHTGTINLNGKNTKCFILARNIEKYSFTLGELRGNYLADETLKNTEFNQLFPETYELVCPFSTKNKTYYYCIMENGTVICSCPHCG